MDKKISLLGVFLMIVLSSSMILFSSGIFLSAANANLTLPLNDSNLSKATATFNCTVDLTDIVNVSIYFNSTDPGKHGVPATEGLLYTQVNTSVNQTYFENTTVSLASLTDSASYTFWCSPHNQTMNSHATLLVNSTVQAGVTVDNTAPVVVVHTSYTNNTAKKNSDFFGVNISVIDALSALPDSAFCFFDANTTNQTVSLTKASTSAGWCNTTRLNLTNLADGSTRINVYINDSLNNLQLNNTRYFLADSTAPTLTPSCSPNSVVEGSTITCTCSGSDATSGIASQTAEEKITKDVEGAYTYSCTITDVAGNSATTTAAYTYIGLGGTGSSSGGGGGGSGTVSASNVNTFTKITPGAASIMKVTNKDTGVKEIQIEVNNEAKNVKVTVSKHTGKPAAVSVAKTGTVYQYLQVEVSNVEGNLKKGMITTKVEKSWLTDNGVANADVVVSKFDEAGSKWDELVTTFDSEDDTYAYFTVEVDSFSYFAISEKVIVEEEKPSVVSDVLEGLGITSSNDDEDEGKKNLTWLWIVIALIVIAVGYGVAKKKGTFSK